MSCGLRRVGSILSLFILAGCGELTGPRSFPLARQLWAAQNLSHYDYVGARACFCQGPFGPVTVSVANDQVVRVIDHSNGAAISTAGWLTIDEMFDEAERAIANNELNHIEFDETAGYPTVLDHGRWEVDGGLRRTVSSLRNTAFDR